MKKLSIIIIFASLISFFCNATTINYSDVISLDNAYCTNMCNKMNINLSLTETVEIEDIKFAQMYKIMKLIQEHPEYIPEFDTLLASADNVTKVINGPIYEYMTQKSLFPKYFKIQNDILAKTKPTLAAKFDKIGISMFYKLSASDCIEIFNANEIDIGNIEQMNKIIMNDSFIYVKKWIRSSGKTFVSKRDSNGRVLENPLTTPLNELVNALNSPYFNGFNEWIDKYEAEWPKIDVSNFPKGDELEQLKNDVLFGIKPVNDYIFQLRICLGVDQFNEFVNIYNEGSN